MEPAIRLKDNNNKFMCPLTCWKLNKSKYKLIAILAAQFLCIPATSAPAAGLTIAKDRARLSPENANELIFLHDVEPAIKRYEEVERERMQWPL